MDTSITIVIVVAVLFAFTLPALLRRWDPAAAQPADRHTLPDTASPVTARTPGACRGSANAPGMATAPPGSVRLPAAPAFAQEAPALSLRRERAALAVVAGEAGIAAAEARGESARTESAPTEAARPEAAQAESSLAEPVLAELPLAAGQGAALPPLTVLSSGPAAAAPRGPSSPSGTAHSPVASHGPVASHSPASPHGPGSSLGPDQHSPVSSHSPDTHRPDHRRPAPAAPTHPMDAAMTDSRSPRPARQARPASARRPGPTGAAAARRPAPAEPGARSTAQAPAREAAGRQAPPRRAMRALGLGFAAFGLLALITAACCLFTALSWGVPVLGLALALGCLLVVMALNGLRAPAESHDAGRMSHDTAPQDTAPQDAPTQDAAPRTSREAGRRNHGTRPAAVEARSRHRAGLAGPGEDRAQAGRPAAAAPVREVISVADAAQRRAAAHTQQTATTAHGAQPQAAGTADHGTAERELRAYQPAGAAVAHAAARRAARARTTAEEAATGPIPVVAAQSTPAQSTQGPSTAAQATQADAETAPAASTAGRHAAPELHLGPAEPVRVAHQESAAEAAETERTAKHRDPLADRLGSVGWKPARVPAPTYTEVPQAPREPVEPVVADASSAAPAARESLAERFAAELGYRPEIEDAARTGEAAEPKADAAAGASASDPLAHGRAALGTDRPPRPGSTAHSAQAKIDDALARRRA